MYKNENDKQYHTGTNNKLIILDLSWAATEMICITNYKQLSPSNK
jgi:hypothetical protein